MEAIEISQSQTTGYSPVKVGIAAVVVAAAGYGIGKAGEKGWKWFQARRAAKRAAAAEKAAAEKAAAAENAALNKPGKAEWPQSDLRDKSKMVDLSNRAK